MGVEYVGTTVTVTMNGVAAIGTGTLVSFPLTSACAVSSGHRARRER